MMNQKGSNTTMLATAAAGAPPSLLTQVGMAGTAAVLTVTVIHPIDVIKVRESRSVSASLQRCRYKKGFSSSMTMLHVITTSIVDVEVGLQGKRTCLAIGLESENL